MSEKKCNNTAAFLCVPTLVLTLALAGGVCHAEVWTSTGGPPYDEPVLSLLTVGTTVYAGMGEGRIYKYDGTSWKYIGIPETTGEIRDLVTIGGDLYAGAGWYVWRYDGSVWRHTSGPADGEITCLLFDGTVLFAGTGSGIFTYNRDNDKWTEIAYLPDHTFYSINTLALYKSDVYAMSEMGVYKYDYGRDKWINTGCPTVSARAGNPLLSAGNYLYAGKENVYRYDGTSWHDTGTLGDDAGDTGDDDDLAYNLTSAGGHICTGTYYGRVYKYDGASWLYTGRPGNRTYHIWSMAAIGDVAYAGTWWGTVYKCTISCGDKLSLGTGTLHAWRQFKLGISLAQDITRSSDIYLLAEVPRYGFFSIHPNGSLEKGIKPIYRNLPSLSAPMSTSITAAVALPEALRGSTLTFYIVAVDAGKIPPVSGLAALNASSPYVNAFDKRSAVVE